MGERGKMEEVLSFDPEEYLSCISFLIRFNALSVQYLILLIFSVFARSKLVLVHAFLFFFFYVHLQHQAFCVVMILDHNPLDLKLSLGFLSSSQFMAIEICLSEFFSTCFALPSVFF